MPHSFINGFCTQRHNTRTHTMSIHRERAISRTKTRDVGSVVAGSFIKSPQEMVGYTNITLPDSMLPVRETHHIVLLGSLGFFEVALEKLRSRGGEASYAIPHT